MKCASAQLLAERYSDHTKAHGNHRCLVSRGKRIGFAWPGKESGEGAWLLAKWFGGDMIRVLCPVVASAVGLVKSEKETGLLLFGRGLTVVSDYCEKHTALTKLFCLWALEIAQLPCELNQFSDVTEDEPYRKWNTYVISRTQELILCGCGCRVGVVLEVSGWADVELLLLSQMDWCFQLAEVASPACSLLPSDC